MARAKHTYAVRLAVEGGNKVKADLVSVGTSGERSIKKLDRASDKASRGLGTLGDRASSLRRNMRLLGGVVAGVAAAGGLALLVKRSIDAADAIAKTADAIGISTDALQELRFAADLSGVSVESLDKALKFATKAIGELRTRTSSELTTALKDFDAQLLSNIRNAGSVEEAIELVFRRMGEMEDATKKAALSKSVFGRAGMVMVNIARGEAGALEEMRQQARDLGIVLDEDLLRSAENTKDQLTVLGTVLSANLNKAVLEHADAIGDLAERFTEALPDLISWVSTFGQWIGLIEQSKTERLAEIREEIVRLEGVLQGSQGLGDFFGMGPTHKGRVEDRLDELAAKAAELKRQIEETEAAKRLLLDPIKSTSETKSGAGGDPPADDPVMTAEQQAQHLVQIEKSLGAQLLQLRHEGADRIRAEHLKLVTELQTLIKPDASNLDKVEQALNNAAAVRDLKLTQLADREELAADQRTEANQRVVESLGIELEALKKIDRQRFIDVALRRLSAEATEPQRQEVEKLAGALFDEQEKIEEANKAREDANQLRAEGKALTKSLRTAEEAYADEIERLNELLAEKAIDQETFARASEEAYDRMLDASREWSDGVRRAIRDYLDEAGDAAKQFERATTRALQASEDAFVEWAQTGKFSAKDLFNTIAQEALRAAYRMAVAAPLDNILGSIFAALVPTPAGPYAGAAPGTAPVIPVYSAPLSASLFHGGGVIGRDALPTHMVDPRAFDHASRYHRGGLVGGAGGVPIWAQAGEGVFTPGQMRSLAPVSEAKPTVNVAVNVRNTAPGTRASADVRRESGGDLSLDIVIEQVEGGMARRIGRSEGLAPMLERRYGLNPAAGSMR